MTPIDPTKEIKEEMQKEKNGYIIFFPGIRALSEPGDFDKLREEADYIAYGLREMGYEINQWSYTDLDKWPITTDTRLLDGKKPN